MDLRCKHRKFGVITQPGSGLIEVSCPSRWCGRKPGVVVLHVFDISNGALVKTTLYRDPRKE